MSHWRAAVGERTVRLALAGLAVAVVALGWSLRRAWALDEVAARGGAVELSREALLGRPAVGPVDVRSAVAADLFAPTRTAPASRYRMPGEAVPVVATSAAAPALPVVLGTAIAGDGKSFATCQFESSRLLMVRVGDRVGPYLVKSIERGRVTFVTPSGERLDILALRPGS